MQDSGSWSVPMKRATTIGRRFHQFAFALVLIAFLAACSQTTTPYSNDDLSVSFYEGDVVEASRVDNIKDKSVGGTLIVQVDTHKHGDNVRFYLDDPEMTADPAHIATARPFTFEVDTTSLEDGRHTVTAVAVWKNGRIGKPLTVDFTVSNDAPGDTPTDPDPQPEPGPNPDPTPEPDPTPDPDPTPEPGPDPKPTPIKGTLFVSTKGNDNNDGRSVDRPLRTITKAARTVRPGDVVQIRGGVYSEYNQANAWKTSGRPDAPITIMAYPGEEVIIDGSHVGPNSSNPSAPQLIRLLDVDWYVIQDLTLRNSGGRGLALEGNNHVVRNVVSHGRSEEHTSELQSRPHLVCRL